MQKEKRWSEGAQIKVIWLLLTDVIKRPTATLIHFIQRWINTNRNWKDISTSTAAGNLILFHLFLRKFSTKLTILQRSKNSEPLLFISIYLNTSQWFVTHELLETIQLPKLLILLLQSYLRKQIKTGNIVCFFESDVVDASSRSAEVSFLVMMQWLHNFVTTPLWPTWPSYRAPNGAAIHFYAWLCLCPYASNVVNHITCYLSLPLLLWSALGHLPKFLCCVLPISHYQGVSPIYVITLFSSSDTV